MKKEYISPELKARELPPLCTIEVSNVVVGGDTDEYDARKNTYFEEDEEDEYYE